MNVGLWLRVLGCDLTRQPRQVAGRLAVIGLGAFVLGAFAFVLPAYRSSFTAAIEQAAFDVDLAACECSQRDVARLRSLPGADRLLPVLGISGLAVTFGPTQAGAWAWALDSVDDADLLPLSPAYVIEGKYDLGTPSQPRIVIDRELARLLGVGVGDRLRAQFSTSVVDLTIAGVTGPAARFRGPALVLLRQVVTPFIPANSDLVGDPYTEVFIAGTVSTDQVAALFPLGTTAVYTKENQIAAQEAQIELSQPVIEVVSALAGVGLAGILAFAGWQAIDRRRELLSLLPHMGSPWSAGLAATLIIEGLPAALTSAVATAGGILVVVNGYFAGVGAFVSLPSVLLASVAVALVAQLFHGLSYAAGYSRLASR
ncbi:MAG: hypothetical protein V4515_10050 [Chloroflexota bacterium]